MSLSEPDLVVGRDFAHVWELVKKYPNVEVVDSGAFFKRVSLLAFFADADLLRDEVAPFIIAQNILAKTKEYPLSLAKNFASLYSSLLQGGCRLSQLQDPLVDASESLKKVIKTAALIEEKMEENSLVTTAGALFLAYEILRDKKIVPQALAHLPRVSLHYLVDLTVLQTNVIKELSALGMRFELVMPADFRHKGINASADFMVQQFLPQESFPNIEFRFENIAKNGPLRVLVDNIFDDDTSVALSSENSCVFAAGRVDEEAQIIAQKIAQIKTDKPDDSVALVVRSRDARLEVYKRGLLRHNIDLSDRHGVPLIDLGCGILLSTLFSARLSHLSRKDLVGLIQHEMFAFHVESQAERVWLSILFNRVGVDDNVICDKSACRYLGKLEKYHRFLSSESDEANKVSEAISLISNIKNVLYLLQNEDSFYGFLLAVEKILQIATIKKTLDNSFYAVFGVISDLKNSRSHCLYEQQKITINEFFILFKNLLQSKTILSVKESLPGSVEILLLPEMLGRSFSHVFIADMAFGRIPQNFSQDALVNDELRMELNTILQAFVLPIFFDDPFEPLPIPSLQSREPFWLASAIASAESSIAFSYARHDLAGKEQAASEFFVWLRKNIVLEPANLEQPIKFCSPENLRFWQGKRDRQNENPSSLPHQALLERKRAFSEQIPGEYAFGFSPQDICESFSGRIGKKSSRALTPTFIETFSSCSFKGFYQRILQIDESSHDNDDMDMRALGKLAHKALEIFFAEPCRTNNKKEIDGRVGYILQKVTHEYCQKNYIKNDTVFFCQSEWLKDALVNLIVDIFEQNPSTLLRTPKREVCLGLGKSPPLLLEFNKRKYFLGGIADRIDDTDAGFSVMDYKLSSLVNLAMATSPKALLKTHFQMPIYLRLVSKYNACDEYEKVSFVFASIRDGALLKPVTFHKNQRLFELIFNDNEPDGLAARIDAIFFPIAQGKVLAQVSQGCSHCKLSQICRKDEAN